MKKFNLLAAVCAVSTGLISTPTMAALVTPPSLNPGDQYRIVFVTSSKIRGTSTNINTYNVFADGLGDSALFASDWTAILSTPTVDARTNTLTTGSGAGISIWLVDGSTKVADSYSDLWDGSLDNSINQTQTGGAPPITFGAARVWTGSSDDGLEFSNTRGLGTANPINGDASAANGSWIFAGSVASSNPFSGDPFLPVYALSGVLQVPSAVPIPAAAWLFGSGLLGLAGVARQKKA